MVTYEFKDVSVPAAAMTAGYKDDLSMTETSWNTLVAPKRALESPLKHS